MARVKEQDVKYFRMNGQTTHHHYLRQILHVSKDKPCRKVVNLTSLEAWSSQADEAFKQPNLLPESILSSVIW